MIKFIRKLFITDWKVVYVKNGYCTEEKQATNYVLCEIYYSEILNEYKLKTSGYKPKLHSVYSSVVDKFNELNKKNCYSVLAARHIFIV